MPEIVTNIRLAYILGLVTAALLTISCAIPLVQGSASDTLNPGKLPEAVTRYYVTVAVKSPEVSSATNDARGVRHAGGVLLGGSGLAVTAAHVARSTDNRATVTTLDGATYPAVITHVSPSRELAVLKVNLPPARIPPVPTMNAWPPPGERVVAIGFPDSHAVTARTGTVREAREDGEFRFDRFGFSDPIVLNMRVESGFSGGPVFDRRHRWLGMIVGYDLARKEDGEYVRVHKTYVIPATGISAYVNSLAD